MLRLAIIALFGWAAYRIVEENRAAPILLPAPGDDDSDSLNETSEPSAVGPRRRPSQRRSTR